MFDIDKSIEDEFKRRCTEIAMYQPSVRTTLDGEWTEEELREDVYDRDNDRWCIEEISIQGIKG